MSTQPPTHAGTPGHQILLVDGDPRARRQLAQALRGQGWSVDERDDAHHLLLRAGPAVAALVLDAATAGSAFAPELLRLRAASRVPVVVLQRRPDRLDEVLALELGADAVLPKPVDAPELALRLARLVALHRQPALAAARAPGLARQLRRFRGIGHLLAELDALP